MTGDHGLVHVNKTGRIITKDIPNFLDNLNRPPSGDSWASFLKLYNSDIEKIQQLLHPYKDKFDVFPSSKFIKEGFFGSTITNPDLNSVLGDLTVLSRKGVALMHRFRTDQKASLKGYHGGLVDDELFVPLFTIKPKNIS